MDQENAALTVFYVKLTVFFVRRLMSLFIAHKILALTLAVYHIILHGHIYNFQVKNVPAMFGPFLYRPRVFASVTWLSCQSW